ncbi:magnesium transporter CorA family protein [Arsenicicoccus piscis]|uniref:Magnesium transporter n=1 Tax=Arsenicicoccus piscis TaxID=673954 RepID=A0ABQ6HHU5_9MICO|nr:magnesium transporter CorA family protein [Arsenicicoccus piscis]MCH8627624.1 magnesium transporter CorA family protein [Arsenicicoccus piscis]GMA18115.1 magnesium transporter [Arsenicicoccus piscis]
MLAMPSLVDARAWRDGRPAPLPEDPQSLRAALQDPHLLVWLDLLRPSVAELTQLADYCDLGPTVVEDALEPHERPKVTRHGGHLFFSTYLTDLVELPPDANRGRLVTHRVSGIVLPMALITVRLDEASTLDAVVARWEDDPDLLRLGSGALVHGLLDYAVDGHFETIQELDDEIEALADVLFEERRTGADFLRRVYGLRRDLVALRRMVLPMREVVSALLRHRTRDATALDSWYDDLYDHVLRAAEWTESLRDMMTSVFETNLSLQDARLNTIMKQLSGWAAIIAVPTAITGWFGQNIPFPGYNQPLGLLVSASLVLVGSLVLYLVFRARDWL